MDEIRISYLDREYVRKLETWTVLQVKEDIALLINDNGMEMHVSLSEIGPFVEEDDVYSTETGGWQFLPEETEKRLKAKKSGGKNGT